MLAGNRGPDAAWGGKLQLLPSPTYKGNKSDGSHFLSKSRSGFLSLPQPKSSSSTRRSASAATLQDIEEVRALAKDEPPSEQEPSQGKGTDHGNLMLRLKSREARAKAEANKDFLQQYRTCGEPNAKSDDRLDKLLQATAARADELRVRSEELQVEATDAERRLERANAQNVMRATDTELMTMDQFAKTQRRIQEDKREEELQRQRDEAQQNWVRVHRKLQSELIELRDYKVLLREFRRLRLEKLQESLGRTNDGGRLRSSVREMIRHGAQRILNRLENASVPLDPWMREVLVNSCHLELRIEDAERKLLTLRRQALGPVKSDIQDMLSQTKQERFEALCVRTWECRPRDEPRSAPGATPPVDEKERRGSNAGLSDVDNLLRATGDSVVFGGAGNSDAFRATSNSDAFRATSNSVTFGGATGNTQTQHFSTTGNTVAFDLPNGISPTTKFATRVPPDISAQMNAVEADIAAVKRLLVDMRQNAAAVICHQIREAEKSGGRDAGSDAMHWGFAMLKLLVNEDFAKQTMKELQKSAPQGKFAF